MRPHPPITIDPNVRSPRYAQVYAVLRDWILQGVYAHGERLPSESELSDLFSVSRITIRSAVEMLEKEGMVERIQGRGTFVSGQAADAPNRGDLSELVRRLRTLDGRSKLGDLVIRTESADDQVVRDLQLDGPEDVVHASYIRLRDGEAIGVTDIYVPARLNVEITPEDLHAPSPTLLESKGIAILGAHQLIGATLADSQLSSKLDVPVGSPLVRLSLLVMDADNRPVELLLAHYRADKYTHHVFLASRATAAPPPASPKPR
ncbi:GntR family transcriptional regulator [Brevundimonas faecalis]|uniref:GntR family transcriptional regulator n=1 Tax=Brevundimonas faecalis TaxID=947378 RepID=A0ABV2R9T0_9CAUL